MSSSSSFIFQFEAQSLDKKDFFSESDPYFLFYAQGKKKEKVLLYKSEVLNDNPDPVWKSFKINLSELGNLGHSSNPSITIQVYDKNRIFKDTLIGELKTQFNTLFSQRAFNLVLLKKKKRINGGILKVVLCQVEGRSPKPSVFTKGELEEYSKEEWFCPDLPKSEIESKLAEADVGTFIISCDKETQSYNLSYKTTKGIEYSVISKKETTLKEVVEMGKRIKKEIHSVEEQLVGMGFQREKVQQVLQMEEFKENLTSSDPDLKPIVDQLVIDANKEDAEKEISERQKKLQRRMKLLKNYVKSKAWKDDTPNPFDEVAANVKDTKPALEESLEKYEWYFGDISRNKAEQYLSGCHENSFLVRSSFLDAFVCSAFDAQSGKIAHTIIYHLPDGDYRLGIGGDSFSSVIELVEQSIQPNYQPCERPSSGSSVDPSVKFINRTNALRWILGFRRPEADIPMTPPDERIEEGMPVDTDDAPDRPLSSSSKSAPATPPVSPSSNKGKGLTLSSSAAFVTLSSQPEYLGGISGAYPPGTHLTLYNYDFLPGEKIFGEIYLVLEEPEVVFRVEVHLLLLERTYNGAYGFPDSYPAEMSYVGRTNHSWAETVWQPETPQLLDKGEHRFQFHFKAPRSLIPSIFYKDLAFNFYCFRGIMIPEDVAKENTSSQVYGFLERKTKFISDRVLVDFYGTHPDYWENVSEKSPVLHQKKRFAKDKISIIVNVGKKHHRMWDQMMVQVIVDNEGDEPIIVKVELKQLIRIASPNFEKVMKDEAIVTLSSEKIAEGTKQKQIDFPIDIPGNEENGYTADTVILPSSGSTKLWNVEHYLKISVEGTDITSKLVELFTNNENAVELPIIILNETIREASLSDNLLDVGRIFGVAVPDDYQ